MYTKKTLLSSLFTTMVILMLAVPTAILPKSHATATSEFPQQLFVSFCQDFEKPLMLKAAKGTDGQQQENPNYSLPPQSSTNYPKIPSDEPFSIGVALLTQARGLSVERVSLTPVDGENTDRIELEPTGLFDDEYSLANQNSGDYILQVLVERQGMQAGYETRLSILDEDDECDTTGGDANPDKKIIKIFKRPLVIPGEDDDADDNQTNGNGTNGNGTNGNGTNGNVTGPSGNITDNGNTTNPNSGPNMTDIGSVFPNENFTDTNPSDSPNMTEFRTAEECPEGYQLLNGECQAIIEEPGEETPPPGNELLPPEEVDGESEAGEQEETGEQEEEEEQEQEESSEQPQPQFG